MQFAYLLDWLVLFPKEIVKNAAQIAANQIEAVYASTIKTRDKMAKMAQKRQIISQNDVTLYHEALCEYNMHLVLTELRFKMNIFDSFQG